MNISTILDFVAIVISVIACIVSLNSARYSKRQAKAAEEQVSEMRRQFDADRNPSSAAGTLLSMLQKKVNETENYLLCADLDYDVFALDTYDEALNSGRDRLKKDLQELVCKGFISSYEVRPYGIHVYLTKEGMDYKID